MRNIMIFQHVGHEPLGTLNPLLKKAGFKIRYINFGRDQEVQPKLDSYNGLIILGGPMGVYEMEKYPHIKTELKLIEQALKKEIPVLGICLGSQMLAQALGSPSRKGNGREIGWYPFHLTEAGSKDPLFKEYRSKETLFQWHGDTFDLPKGAVHLAKSDRYESQAFRYGKNVYGFQFHLEVDQPMIHRWLSIPHNKAELAEPGTDFSAEQIENETHLHISRSLELSHHTFSNFISLFSLKERPIALGSGHGKPGKQS